MESTLSSGSNTNHDKTVSINLEECSALKCIVNESDTNRLRCSKCSRLVHFTCSKLPAYHIKTYIDKKSRHFHCISCVDVPSDLNVLIEKGNTMNQS